MEPARYGAFISYRHSADDRRFAQRLHAELEAWSTPAHLVQQGARGKVGRVFRDEEELAASADLSAEIDAALQSSECLVVVCSPRTPASRWVNEEVLRFRALGLSHRILACLIEGEPADAFPPALLAAMDGSAREPLAADFRRPGNGSPKATQRLAKLRLLAALVGCRFDDLVLREQARRRRRTAIGTALLVSVIALFGVLALVALQQRDSAEAQRKLAEQRRDETLLTQSRFLGSLSTQALAEGHASLAALLALEALPRPQSPEDRPYYSPAMGALYAAMLGQRERLTLGAGGLDHTGAPTPSAASARFTTDGRRLIVGTASGAVEVWDIVGRRREASVSLASAPVVRLAFDGAGRRGFAAAAGQVFEVDLVGGRARPVAGVEGQVEALTQHDDGSVFVTLAADNETMRAVRWTRTPDGRFVAGQAVEFRLDLLFHHAVSADGRHLAFGNGRTPGLVLVDLTSGARRRLEPPVLMTDPGTLFATFAPSGDRLLVSSPRHVLLLDLTGRSVPRELRGHQDSVLRAAIAPDGRSIATGGDDGLVLLWGPQNGYARPLRSFGGFRRGDNKGLQQGAEIERTLLLPQRMHDLFEGAVGHLAFSADATRLAATSGDRTLAVYDLRSNAAPMRLSGHGGRVDELAITANGTHLMTLDHEGAARVWTTVESKPTILPSGVSSVRDVFMPTGPMPPLVLVRHSETRCGGLWRAWRLGAPEPLGPASAPMSTLSFDGGTLLAGDPENGSLQRVDLADGRTNSIDLPPGAATVDCAYIDPVRYDMLLTSDNGPPRRQPLPGPPVPAASAPAVPPDAAHAEVLQALLAHGAVRPTDERLSNHFLVNRDADRALVWRSGGFVALLDLRSGAELRRLRERDFLAASTLADDDGHSFAFSDDGRYVLSLHVSGVRLWKSADGSVMRDVPTRSGKPLFATLGGLPSQRLVVLEAERIVVHDPRGERPAVERPMPFDEGAEARLSPDGRRLAVGGGKTCGSLWDTDALVKVADLTLPAGCPTSFVFSPDSSTLLTTVWEPQGLALWDARGGTQLVRHGGCTDGNNEMGDADPADVMTAGFSADGGQVFVGTLGGVVCVWPHFGGGSVLMANAQRLLSRGLSAPELARFPVQPALPR